MDYMVYILYYYYLNMFNNSVTFFKLNIKFSPLFNFSKSTNDDINIVETPKTNEQQFEYIKKIQPYRDMIKKDPNNLKNIPCNDVNDELIYYAIWESEGKIPTSTIMHYKITPTLQNRINKLCHNYKNNFETQKNSYCYQIRKKYPKYE